MPLHPATFTIRCTASSAHLSAAAVARRAAQLEAPTEAGGTSGKGWIASTCVCGNEAAALKAAARQAADLLQDSPTLKAVHFAASSKAILANAQAAVCSAVVDGKQAAGGVAAAAAEAVAALTKAGAAVACC